VAVDLLLAAFDGRSELALTIVECLSNIAGSGTEGLVDVASTGFKHGTKTLHAGIERCRTAGKSLKQDIAALAERGFDLLDMRLEFLADPISGLAKRIDQIRTARGEDIVQHAGCAVDMAVECRDARV